MTQRKCTAEDIISAHDLEPHIEGGYFRRTYQADHPDMLQTAHVHAIC